MFEGHKTLMRTSRGEKHFRHAAGVRVEEVDGGAGERLEGGGGVGVSERPEASLVEHEQRGHRALEERALGEAQAPEPERHVAHRAVERVRPARARGPGVAPDAQDWRARRDAHAHVCGQRGGRRRRWRGPPLAVVHDELCATDSRVHSECESSSRFEMRILEKIIYCTRNLVLRILYSGTGRCAPAEADVSPRVRLNCRVDRLEVPLCRASCHLNAGKATLYLQQNFIVFTYGEQNKLTSVMTPN